MQPKNSSQKEKGTPKLKDELSKINGLISENTHLNNILTEPNQKEKILKIIMVLKYFSTMKIAKEDNKPVELIDSLFIGSIAAASNKQGLLDNKITHIVVAASGLKENYPNDFKYIKFNVLDSTTQNIKQHFIAAGEFIDNAISNGGRVLVHCHAGISRSSTIVLSYLIKYKKMRLDAALKLIKSKREKINPNSGFIQQLKEYEEEHLGKDEYLSAT